MPDIAHTTVCLRIFGDPLDPDEITRLLGIEPTRFARKGDIRATASGRKVVARCGSWRLDAGAPGSLDAQIDALLAKLPVDEAVWRELSDRYECDVFCGLFMHDFNEGTELSPQVMLMLGVRHLRLGIDIYNTLE